MKTSLLLLLALSVTCKSFSQTTPRRTPPAPSPAATVCIPAVKARLIMADLLRLPVVLDENRALRRAGAARRDESTALRESLSAKDTVIAATERRLVVNRSLGRDAENRAAQWRGRAKVRWWTNVGLGALVLLLGAAILR